MVTKDNKIEKNNPQNCSTLLSFKERESQTLHFSYFKCGYLYSLNERILNPWHKINAPFNLE